jgi:hypothetical protein
MSTRNNCTDGYLKLIAVIVSHLMTQLYPLSIKRVNEKLNRVRQVILHTYSCFIRQSMQSDELPSGHHIPLQSDPVLEPLLSRLANFCAKTRNNSILQTRYLSLCCDSGNHVRYQLRDVSIMPGLCSRRSLWHDALRFRVRTSIPTRDARHCLVRGSYPTRSHFMNSQEKVRRFGLILILYYRACKTSPLGVKWTPPVYTHRP